MSIPKVYDLTALTRTAAERRRVVIQGWDVERRHFILFLVGLIPLIPVLVVGFSLFGTYAIFLVPVVYIPLFVLVLGQSNRGMELSNWRTIWNRRTSNDGHFMLRGKEMKPERHDPRILRSASVPGPGLERATSRSDTELDELFT